MAWTDEDIKKLTQLWEQGLSTVAIGLALGIIKNAVIGKVHRLQLQARPSPIRTAGKPAPKKATLAKKSAKPAPSKATKAPAKATPTSSKKTAPAAQKAVAKKPSAPVPAQKKTAAPKVQPKQAAPKKAAPVKAVPAAKKSAEKAPQTTEVAKPAKGLKKVPRPTVILPKSRRDMFIKKTSQHVHKGIPLTELKTNSCRWPLGDPTDPDFSFCGKEAVPGKPYCAAHCVEAYTGVFKPR